MASGAGSENRGRTPGTRRVVTAAGVVCLLVAAAFVCCPPSGLLTLMERLHAPGAGSFAAQALVFAGLLLVGVGLFGQWLSETAGRAAEWLGQVPERKFLVVLVAAALVPRVLFAVWFPTPPAADALCYHTRAVWLVEGRGYVREGPEVDGRPTFVPSAYWPVGYPAFLAGLYGLMGPGPCTGIAVNGFLSAASVVFFYLVGEKAFGRGAAQLGALALCVFVRQIPNDLMSDTLFTVLMGGALAIAVRAPMRWPWAITAGVIHVAATFVRSNGVMLFVLLFAAWWGRSGRLRTAAAMSAVTVAVAAVGPVFWAVRNAEKVGIAAPLSLNAGDMLLFGANDETRGTVPGAIFENHPLYGDIQELRVKKTDEAGAYRLGMARAVEWIRQHPLRWVGLGFVKVGWFTAGTNGWHDELFWASGRTVPRWLTATYRSLERFSYWLILVGFAVYVLRVLGGVRRIVHERDFVTLLPLLVYGCFAAQCFVFAALPRYRLPVEPLMVMAAAAVAVGWRVGDRREDAPREFQAGRSNTRSSWP